MQRFVGFDPYDQSSASSRKSTASHSSKHEVDAVVLDECVRSIMSNIDRLDGQLKEALIDGDQAGVLARSVVEEHSSVWLLCYDRGGLISGRNVPRLSYCKLRYTEGKIIKTCLNGSSRRYRLRWTSFTR